VGPRRKRKEGKRGRERKGDGEKGMDLR